MKSFLRIAMTMTTVVALTGVAAAGDDKAKAAPTPVKADPKAPPVAPTPADKAPVQMPPMPTPTLEVAAAAKALAGNWKCKGQMFKQDGTGVPMSSTWKAKLDLGKFWIHTSFAETGKKAGAYKFEAFTTYDAASKKWHRLQIDNMGGNEVATSDGLKDGKITWESASRSHMGTAKARHFEEMAGKEIKMWGEWSMDGGKTFAKGYESTCKK